MTDTPNTPNTPNTDAKDLPEEVFDPPPPPFERPLPPDGLPWAYSCKHGDSNVPCVCHYAVAMMTGQPDPVTMPDDWYYDPPVATDGGMTDTVIVQ